MKKSASSASSPRRLACSVALVSAIIFGAALNSAAATVTINFDSVSPDSSGIDPAVYLAGYGVTLSGVSPSDPLIYSDLAFYGAGVVDASSGHNFLLQQSAVNGGGFTLNFSTALTNVEFTRIANVAFNAVGYWSATAYSGVSVVGFASENAGLGSFSPALYSFSAPSITSLTFYGNGGGYAGISSAMIDDLKLTSVDTVPDTASTLALMGVAFAGLAAFRRRFAC